MSIIPSYLLSASTPIAPFFNDHSSRIARDWVYKRLTYGDNPTSVAEAVFCKAMRKMPARDLVQLVNYINKLVPYFNHWCRADAPLR